MSPEQVEAQMRAACDAGDYARAATLVIERYGDELLSFLIVRLRTQTDGHEAFSIFAEDLWVGLPGFAWRSSMRTWCYALARNAAARYARSGYRRRERNHTLSLGRHAELSQLVDRVRSRTQLHQRTEAKERMRALRDRLEPEDQMLLVLRVDRGMAFRDLAQVMLGDTDGSTDSALLERETLRLRKRFGRLKDELRTLAKKEGLLDRE